MRFIIGNRSAIGGLTQRLLMAVLTLGIAGAQENCYSQALGVESGAAQPTITPPPMSASPLAGGPAAIGGGQYMNAYGDPIIMPVQYEAPCGDMYGGMGGYGDPMAVDFGGYTEDQIGPHYFDVAFGAVFYKSDDLLAGIGPLAARNAGGIRELDPQDTATSYETGWQVALRYDLGPMSLFEATYLGIYDIGGSQRINSTEINNVPNQLQTVFSNFGVPFPIDGLDDGETYTVAYKSDLQSSELSYRRYWVGNSPRISGTYLLGFRYLRMTEDLNFNGDVLLGTDQTPRMTWAGGNDLLGFQIGGDGWLGLRQGLRIGCEGKAGVYNNRFEFQGDGDFGGVIGAPDNYNVLTQGDQVAFIGEAGANLVLDILPSWSIKGGYNVLYVDNLATVASNFDSTDFIPATFQAKDDVLYHGFNASAEYVW